MGGIVLPPFDLDPPSKLPLEIGELLPEGIEDIDFASVWPQKKEVTLELHHQEVPFLNAFLTRVKMDAGELAHTKATNFSNRVQKSVISAANAFGDMYLTLARTEKEVALARRLSETVKTTTAKAQATLRERNTLQLRVGRLERELKETRKKVEELDAARAEAVEECKGSEELKNLVLDAIVEEQFVWEKLVVRFTLDLDINFDTSGVPLPIPPGRELLFMLPSSADALSPLDAEARGGADVREVLFECRWRSFVCMDTTIP
ncbi:hypothetical protein L3X38_033282 [Prunus dulcis]|uniref:Uncharacterized protein n=1 Tax=Prunus dulcis TaxID=3755 RepID=A0AAD4VFK9_PRUDU|nr:hypothetical protein L3X38_033282 [Prunus dulcis]